MGSLNERKFDHVDNNLLSLQNIKTVLVGKSQKFKLDEHFNCKGRNSSNTNRDNANPLYNLCSMPAAGIQTFPKVSLHLHNKNITTKQENTPVCDPHAPPVALPSGTYVQFDPHRALYSKQMFWALPFYIEQKIEPIWSIIVQKFVWLIGNRLVIHSPGLQPTEETIIDQAQVVNDVLNNFSCKNASLVVCMRNLVKVMIDSARSMNNAFPEVLDQWTQSLTELNYSFPAFHSQQRLQSLAQLNYDFATFEKIQNKFCKQNKIIFQPVDYTQRKSPTGLIPIMNIDEINNIYKETCHGYQNKNHFKQITLSHPWAQFPNILLLVVFNNPHYDSIPYIELLYRPFFPQMLYCGPAKPDFNAPILHGLKNLQFSVFHYTPTRPGYNQGSLNYECMVNALQMKYPVDGILFLSDDVLLVPAEVAKMQTNAVWYVPHWDTINDDIRDPIISQWGFKVHQRFIMHLWDRIERDKNSSFILHQCYQNLLARNGDRYRVNGGFADLYYIPQRIAQEFAFLGSIFLEENVFLEIAVPTIIQCLDGLENVDVLYGEYREKNIAAPWLKFADPKFKGMSYLHRTKWSFLASWSPDKQNFQKFFCTGALPWLHHANGTLPV